MSAWYNENDPKAAAWLRELVKGGHIADGVVDERSIEDVLPNDLKDFTQCHFFAGIGGWSYALRMAGWPDSRPVWTGSCPCQPFSAAGQGKGFADERHLWPAWVHLAEHSRPSTIFGEQVASPAGLIWLRAVQTDLEARGYSFGAADLAAAGISAPHVRQRMYWLAHADQQPCGQGRSLAPRSYPGSNAEPRPRFGSSGGAGKLGDADGAGSQGWLVGRNRADQLPAVAAGMAGELDDANGGGCEVQDVHLRSARPDEAPTVERGASFWSSADWIPCADGKYRPVEPGTFPLAHGIPGRVGLLRGYGNAIVPQVAAAFIEAAMYI